jgi:hypothetical protein
MPELATDLLLIARNPVNGRLRHRSALERGLRAALFTELIVAGLIVDDGGAPYATTRDRSGDHVLDTLHTAVTDRPGTIWRRWFHLVAADRTVLTKKLVEDGRWRRERDRFGRIRWRDTASDSTLALAHTITAVAAFRQPPADRNQAVLAILSTVCGSISGRPHPRELRHSLRPLLDAIGPTSDAMRRDLQANLAGCGLAIRHRTRFLA